MNFDMTDDQLAFADTAKQFAEQELAPHAAGATAGGGSATQNVRMTCRNRAPDAWPL